jgi:hypothetical protein
MAISETAYLYWDQLRINSNDQGGLYEKQPLAVKGNLEEVSGSGKAVLGFFHAASVSSIRLFLVNPGLELTYPDYCNEYSLEEYFNELPVEVKVRKSQGRKFFRFASAQPEMTIFDPLVMVDWVALDDIEKVLSVSPRSIERIELVNAPYIIGSTMYGGIISIISRKEDFAGIDLPASGTFVNYRYFHECPAYEPVHDFEESWPQIQNTLLWEPDLFLGPEGQASCSFHAPDLPGTYTILLRGIDVSGNTTQTSASIEIY